MRRLYLHVGTNKTGTSAIQHFFNERRELLKNYGVLYPKAGCKGEAHYQLSRALGFTYDKSVSHTELIQSILDTLIKEINEANPDCIVMSSEDFMLPKDIHLVREFLDGFDVTIILYLRRHDTWWESAYGQAVKMVAKPPWGRSVTDFIKFEKRKNPGFANYRMIVDRWAKVFERRNVVVRPYEAQQNQPDIVVDFLNTLGLQRVVQGKELEPERTNKSISPLALYLVDIFQRINVPPETRRRLVNHALKLPANEKREMFCSPELRRQLIEENADDYSYIAREYLGRSDGKLFYDDMPDAEGTWEPPRHPTFMRVVEEVLKATGVTSNGSIAGLSDKEPSNQESLEK